MKIVLCNVGSIKAGSGDDNSGVFPGYKKTTAGLTHGLQLDQPNRCFPSMGPAENCGDLFYIGGAIIIRE